MRYLLVCLLLCSAPAYGQEPTTAAAPSSEQILVPKDALPPAVLEKLEAKQQLDAAKQKLETAGEYAKWGREVGVAVNETLKALSDHAINLSKTDVGKFAMFLIAWKVMANDVLTMGDTVVGYLVGVPFFILACLALLWSYRRQCISRRVLIKQGKDEKGQPFKEWKIITPNENPDKGGMSQFEWMWAHALGFALVTVISALLIFA